MQAPIREIPRVSLAIRKRGRPSPPSLAEAVEKELRFRELKGKTGLGYYFSITDKAPSIKAGEYKYMTQGGNSEKDSVDVPIAREIIANAIQK